MTAINNAAQEQTNNGTNRKIIFKNCAFTKCISRMNNTQVDHSHEIDVVMLMYNLIKHSENYSETSGSLWQYCRDEPALAADNNTIPDFYEANVITNYCY